MLWQTDVQHSTAPSRRTEHFHLRPGASGAADEITFYCGERDCRLKSFNDSGFDGALQLASLLSLSLQRRQSLTTLA